ncbi:MAG: DUF3299 domain-containing protein [Planctomycetota bacterium]
MSFKSMTLAGDAEATQIQAYQAVSKAAVLSFAFAAVGLFAFLIPALLFLPLLGLIFGMIGLSNLRRYPDELTGKKSAIVGLLLSVIGLIGATALHVSVYLTEVPEGFQRISFNDLAPDKKNPMMPIPPQAIELEGQRVFLKGYVHPSVDRKGNVDRFLLVPDMGTCCFGGQPKLTDMIEVKLVGGLSVRYSYRKLALAGTFHLDPTVSARDGSQGPCYKLIAEYLK